MSKLTDRISYLANTRHPGHMEMQSVINDVVELETSNRKMADEMRNLSKISKSMASVASDLKRVAELVSSDLEAGVMNSKEMIGHLQKATGAAEEAGL